METRCVSCCRYGGKGKQRRPQGSSPVQVKHGGVEDAIEAVRVFRLADVGRGSSS